MTAIDSTWTFPGGNDMVQWFQRLAEVLATVAPVVEFLCTALGSA